MWTKFGQILSYPPFISLLFFIKYIANKYFLLLESLFYSAVQLHIQSPRSPNKIMPSNYNYCIIATTVCKEKNATRKKKKTR